MPFHRAISGLLLVLLPFALAAEVYRVENEDGKVIFTDTPPSNANKGDKKIESVDLPTVNTQPGLVVPSSKSEADKHLAYSRVAITSPADGSTITPGQLDIIVNIALEPTLQQGHNVEVLYDGSPYTAPAPTTSFRITDLIRGTHHLKAIIRDANNKIVGQSQSVTVFVHRASALNR